MKFIIRHILYFLVLASFKTEAQKNSSVLKSGDWYKIVVLQEGVYKIDAALLDEMGIDRFGINPNNIALYGNAYNGMLPQPNRDPRPDDLLENRLYAVGLADGSFGSSDYLLFYGKSSDHESFNASTDEFYYQKNLYCDSSFYFLTVKEDNGLRMSQSNNGTSSAAYSNSYTKFIPHESDLFNLLRSGRNWYGERMTQSNTTKTIEFSNLDLISNSEIKIYTSVLSRATTPSSFFIDINGVPLKTITMSPVSSAEYQTKADIKNDTLSLSTNQLNSSETLTLTYKYNLSGEVSDGYVDYAHVIVEHELDLSNGQINFHHTPEHQAYQISGANESTMVFEVSDPLSAEIVNVNRTGGVARFVPAVGHSKFVAFREGQEIKPVFIEKIANQNLHGLPMADAIYITHNNFRSEAERLANFRTASDGLLTEVVTVDEIYNEYSSGRQDITAIRDFIRHQYLKSGQNLKYVTLFGDCSYDYKDRSIVQTNFVPVYETRNSIHELNSYSSEDYYGFMDENEGLWPESSDGDDPLDIGIGRIPVQTIEQAAGVVNKIMRYEKSSSAYGKWRNQITFVADDGDSNIHQIDADAMASIVNDNHNVFNIEKIYLDAYKQTNLPNGQISEAASDAFLEALSNGNIIVNYTGHGNETLLSHEKILTNDMIDNLSNRQLMPFLITATCDFGRYDDPIRFSGGERMLLHPQGGSIGLLTSTRSVYASSNFVFNEAFYEVAMNKVDGKYLRLGDIIRLTKNNSMQGIRNRNYTLLGDASMRLTFPNQEIKLTSINGQSLENFDTLKALGKYILEGEIETTGTLDEEFNGSVYVSVYDKPSSFRTLGDESVVQEFDIQDVLLFQGESTVNNGKFSTEFIVPKNINYSFSKGKIGFYALNQNKNSDAHGVFSDIMVGGSTDDLVSDNTPPEIDIFLNSTDFVSGQMVNSNSLLLVQLSDESGINISKAGFGQDLKMYLDDNEPTILNKYYTASLDSYQEGLVAYPLDGLSPGSHVLTIDAFDVHNNRSSAEINFTVSESDGILISSLSNYPNPVVEHTTFTFTHDRSGDDLNVALIITNMQGQEILRNDYRFEGSPTKIDNILWNATDFSGNRLKKGIYIYKILVQSEVDGASTEKYRKLIILN